MAVIDFQHRDGSCGNYNILETVTAGLALFDYDNDGDEDIYFVSGGAPKGTDYPSPPANALYRNDGNWRFTDVTAQSGVGDTSHGLAVAAADYDNEGDLDLYVSNHGPNILYRNNGDDTSPRGHWLQVKLRGTRTNRDGVGARVKVVADDLVLVDEVHSGRGYQSHYGMRLYFGLGARNAVDRVEVRWIGGGVEVFRGIAVDQLVNLIEGRALCQGHNGKISYL